MGKFTFHLKGILEECLIRDDNIGLEAPVLRISDYL